MRLTVDKFNEIAMELLDKAAAKAMRRARKLARAAIKTADQSTQDGHRGAARKGGKS